MRLHVISIAGALSAVLFACLFTAGVQAGSIKSMTDKLTDKITDKLNVKTAPSPASLVHEKWAVVVGIEDFQDPSVTPHRFGERSASELVKALTDPNCGRFAADHVTLLKGNQATKTAIEDAVAKNWLLKKALPRDIVLLYFCTRATPSKDGKELFLCAYDTLGSEAYLSGVPLRELLTELKRRIQTKLMICILDTSPADSTGGKFDLAAFSRASGVTVLSANTPGEPTLESPKADGTCFAHFLCEAVRAGLGTMTLQAISDYVSQHVAETFANTPDKNEKPVLAVAADGQDLLTLAPGIAVKSSTPPHKVAIGHPVDNLPWSRPELTHRQPPAKGAATQKDDDEDEDEPSTNLDFGSYMTKMKRDIQQKWQPPKGFENRRVVVTFTIARDGSILDPQIVESSGADQADRAALDALKVASPLDPLPLGAPKSVQIKYQFEWRVNRN